MSTQVAALGKHVSDLNRLCMIGEHWLAFTTPRRPHGTLSCACGCIEGHRAIGFLSVESPVYKLPVDITNEPKNYGAGFAPKAIAKFILNGGKLPSWAYATETPFVRPSK